MTAEQKSVIAAILRMLIASLLWSGWRDAVIVKHELVGDASILGRFYPLICLHLNTDNADTSTRVQIQQWVID